MLGGTGNEILIGQLRFQCGNFACRLFELAGKPDTFRLEIDDLGDRQRNRGLAEHDLHRTRRHAIGEPDLAQPRQPRDLASPVLRTPAGFRTGSDDDTGQLRAGGNIHLRPHRPDIRHQPDQPADLGIGGFVGVPALTGPWRKDER